jgi:uncharacterized protein (DUF362 family)
MTDLIKPVNRIFSCSRRQFFGLSTGLVSSAVLARFDNNVLASPGAAPSVLSGDVPSVSGIWVPRNDTDAAVPLIQEMIENAGGLGWLSPGDSVLLKIALNSGNPYPATSDPWLLEQVIGVLRAKGAGEILVGDQSGVEAVHWTRDQKRGSSRTLCRDAGLLAVIEANDAKAVFFEEAGYEAYIETVPEGAHHWHEPLWVADIVNRVDHIIYLPRVAAHIMGDITAGLKLGVGFLREDSRLAFHRGGDSFYALYEEINQVPEIRQKLRLVVTSGRQVITTVGPDWGDITQPEYGLVFASEDLLAAELVAYAWLLWNRQFETSGFARLTKGNLNRFRSFINRKFIDRYWKPNDGIDALDLAVFRAGSIYDHPAIRNNMVRRGGRPEGIDWKPANALADPSVERFLHQQLAV